MRFLYSIAGIVLKGETPYDLTLQEESIPFLIQYADVSNFNVEIEFNKLSSIQTPDSKGMKKGNRLYCRKDDSEIVCFYPPKDDLPYACVHHAKNKLRIDYTEASVPYINYSHNLIDLISLEMLMLDYHGIIIHSSFISWRNRGIIFAGPSGSGKSTQAGLWSQYEQAECLNGDRTGLRKAEGSWISYGLPYAGSSGIYRNESAPLAAVIILRQGKENVVTKMKPSEAFRAIYPETLIHQWDKSYVKAAAEYITALVTDVPVYLLSCRPDRGAVSVLRDELVKEGIVE